MANFLNLEFPVSSADCAEIESIFIELMRAHDAAPEEAVNSELPFLDPPTSAQDLHSQGGLQ